MARLALLAVGGTLAVGAVLGHMLARSLQQLGLG